MPAKLVGEFTPIVSLDLLNGEWQHLLYLLDEVVRTFNCIVIVDTQYAKTGTVINGGELVIPTSDVDVFEKLDVYLHAIARQRLAVALGITLPLFLVA